jgi:hypothetical protein
VGNGLVVFEKGDKERNNLLKLIRHFGPDRKKKEGRQRSSILVVAQHKTAVFE